MTQKKLSSILIGSFGIYAISDIFSKTVSFFAVPLYTRLLSQELFGLLEMCLVVISLICGIGLFGMPNSLNRFFWEDNADLKKQKVMFSSGMLFILGVNVFLLIIAFLLLIATYPMIDGLKDQSPLILFLCLLIIPSTNSLSYLQTLGRMRFKAVQVMISGLLAYGCAPIVSLVLMIGLGWGIEGVVLGTSFCLLLSVLYLTWDNIDFFILEIDLSFIKSFVNFGAPFIVTTIVFWVFSSTDRFFISHFFGLDEVAQYAVASKIASIPLIVFAAFGAAWSPLSMKLKAEMSDEVFREFLANCLNAGLLLGTIVSGVIALWAGEIIAILFPPSYVAGALASIFLTLGVMLNFTTQFTAVGISLALRTKLFSYLSIGALFINIALNFLLIPRLGLLGASLSTAVSYLALTLGYLFFSMRLFPINLRLGRLLLTSLISLSVFWIAVIYHQAIFDLASLLKGVILFLPFVYLLRELAALKLEIEQIHV